MNSQQCHGQMLKACKFRGFIRSVLGAPIRSRDNSTDAVLPRLDAVVGARLAVLRTRAVDLNVAATASLGSIWQAVDNFPL